MNGLSEKYPIQIVDIYDGNRWNASAEKVKGTRGVIIKAGQGGWPSLPADFVAQCKAAGLPYGVYWLIDSRYDSGYHMQGIKRTFPTMDFGQLGLWWDCEKPVVTMQDRDYWRTPYAGNGLIEAVTDKFLGWSGKTGGIYTSPGFAALNGWSGWMFKLKSISSKLAKMPLWVAQYNNYISAPQLFGKWQNWFMWQYTENPDYSYFNGGEDEFTAWMNGSAVEITPPPPSIYPTAKVMSWVSALNIRTGPGTNYAKTGKTLSGGQTVTVYETKTEATSAWARIGDNQWCAIRYGASVYLEIIK